MQIRYARVYLRETTLITPFPVLLFGGDIEVQHRERLLSVDGWICFQVHAIIYLDLVDYIKILLSVSLR